MRADHPSLVSFYVALASAAFVLNWPWEMAQMSTYAEMVGQPWLATAPICTVATLGDVAITAAVYGIGALACAQVRWGTVPRWNVYATAALLGAGFAVAVEWWALGSGRWSYNEHMPRVPLVGVGLWPFLQLTLLVPAAFWVGVWWGKR